MAHAAGQTNTGADFSSQLELDPKKVIIQIREDNPTKQVEVNIESRAIAQEKRIFFDCTDPNKSTETELWKRKEETRYATRTAAPVVTVSC